MSGMTAATPLVRTRGIPRVQHNLEISRNPDVFAILLQGDPGSRRACEVLGYNVSGRDRHGTGRMRREDLLQRISIDPDVCFGKPCIKGHRVWVSLVLDLLASGKTIEDVLAEYPGLEQEDVLACIAYGAEMSKQRYVDVGPEL
ncbi:MAG TPA: DUF433 domain-containing protein [Candidatus Obscuribacterales bacterium]